MDDNYSMYLKLLTTTQEEIYDLLNKEEENTQSLIPPIDIESVPQPIKNKVTKVWTPLEYLLINCYNDKGFLQLTQNAFQFFTHCEILPMYDIKAIYVGDLLEATKYKTLQELPLLTDDNFFDFQNLIRQILDMPYVEPPDPDEDPRITKMKAKARYRDQVKAKSGKGLSLSNMLTAICCMGIGITPLNIGEMSYSAIASIFSMYQNKEKYDVDVQSLLAGADPKKIKPKYWITN